MNYQIAYHTDVGIKRETNQDSLCVKQAETGAGTVLMAMICDGMGGLEKGELASCSVIKAFSSWFETDLPEDLVKPDPLTEIRNEWTYLIKQKNQDITGYGVSHHLQLGTTLSVIIILPDSSYIIGHVGDSRIYCITDYSADVLTSDQTLVAYELRAGRLTPEQAKVDPRRNVLLQCIGASKVVDPEFYTGRAAAGSCYMLCSDGFRHVLDINEIRTAFAPSANRDENEMKSHIVGLIETNKSRGETDNITAVLIKIQ